VIQMLRTYVRLQTAWLRLRRAQQGLTAIEYGVFAAFVVLMLVGAAVIIGPQLRTWIENTVTCITKRNADGNCS
jgi:Flp pilus assembly pilin Flp